MRASCVTLLLAGAIVAGATSAAAQSNDHLFRSWTWRPEPASARAEGLAGSFVAVADDSAAMVANPAGLAQVTRGELSASLMRRSSRFVAHEGAGLSGLSWADTLAAHSGLGLLAAAVRVRPRLVVGAYLREPQTQELTLDESGYLGGSRSLGAVTIRAREAVGAVAFQVTEGLAVGARVGLARLELQGQGTEQAFVGWSGSRLLMRDERRVSSRVAPGGADRLTGSVGVLVWPSDTVRLGLVAESGVSHNCRRVAVTPPSEEEVESSYDFTQPSRLAVGLAWQAFPRMLLTAQLDYVRYSDMRPQSLVGPFAAEDYVVKDGLEPHAGLELSFPSRSGILQVRSGIHVRASGSPDIRYQGTDRVEQNAWGHDLDRVGLSLGASLLLPHVRFDVARAGGWRSGTTVSLTLRP